MQAKSESSGKKDKILFTPGPLTTSLTVKQAMLRDLGSRDSEFIYIVKDIRRRLVELGEANCDEYTAVPFQGSGTFGLEAVVSSSVPPDGKLLVIINGAYGRRIAKIASVLKIQTVTLDFPENKIPDIPKVEATLENEPGITNVAVVHCETTTGIINPIEQIGEIVKTADRMFFVDAMSSFGAVPVNLMQCNIDYLVSSANKCIEGVPGFSFVLAKIDSLKKTQGWARSLSFDLFEQYRGLEKNGQFRFTPPTHSLVAFHQALLELEEEGGITGRAGRYIKNYEILLAGMRKIGFTEYLSSRNQGYIITSFLYPCSEKFNFEEFYNRLNKKGFVIYPGKVSDADCFRIGNIGRIFESDVNELLDAVRSTINEMGIVFG